MRSVGQQLIPSRYPLASPYQTVEITPPTPTRSFRDHRRAAQEGHEHDPDLPPLTLLAKPIDYCLRASTRSPPCPPGRMAGVRPIAAFDRRGCVSTFDALPLSARGGDVVRTVAGRRGRVQPRSTLVGTWAGRGVRLSSRIRRQQRRRRGGVVVVNEIAGNYEESFSDVDSQLMNYFTYKAVRTVLHQLYEMNPPSYMWFYNYVATNDMSNGKNFLRKLVKEKQDLAERVMVTRLHLYGRWIKKCDHAKMYENISKENLELMRERLIETVVWPSEDTNTGTIG